MMIEGKGIEVKVDGMPIGVAVFDRDFWMKRSIRGRAPEPPPLDRDFFHRGVKWDAPEGYFSRGRGNPRSAWHLVYSYDRVTRTIARLSYEPRGPVWLVERSTKRSHFRKIARCMTLTEAHTALMNELRAEVVERRLRGLPHVRDRAGKYTGDMSGW